LAEATAKITAFWKHGQDIGAVRDDLPVSTLLAMLQDAKLGLIRILMPADRAPNEDEIEAFTRVHFDLVRRITGRR
jgi:hypothetical protein